MATILIVEDETAIADVVEFAVKKAGFEARRVETLTAARRLLRSGQFDLLVLDLGLPDGDGLDLLAELRREQAVPAIILTARETLSDRLAGLDGGADDYVVKPVEMPELIARCRAVLRRPGGRLGTVLAVGELRLDSVQRRVTVGEQTISLGQRDVGVLEQLMRRKGQVVPRRVLEAAVYAFSAEVTPNALEAAISRLRKAIESAEGGVSIHTVRGVGWLIEVDRIDPGTAGEP